MYLYLCTIFVSCAAFEKSIFGLRPMQKYGFHGYLADKFYSRHINTKFDQNPLIYCGAGTFLCKPSTPHALLCILIIRIIQRRTNNFYHSSAYHTSHPESVFYFRYLFIRKPFSNSKYRPHNLGQYAIYLETRFSSRHTSEYSLP